MKKLIFLLMFMFNIFANNIDTIKINERKFIVKTTIYDTVEMKIDTEYIHTYDKQLKINIDTNTYWFPPSRIQYYDNNKISIIPNINNN